MGGRHDKCNAMLIDMIDGEPQKPTRRGWTVVHVAALRGASLDRALFRCQAGYEPASNAVKRVVLVRAEGSEELVQEFLLLEDVQVPVDPVVCEARLCEFGRL